MAGGSKAAVSLFVLAGLWYMVRGINKVQLTEWFEIGGRKELAFVPGSEVAGAVRYL